MAEICHLENRNDAIFFCSEWSDLDKISQSGAEWHDCGDMVKIETRCRIPIWRTFGRITWYVGNFFLFTAVQEFLKSIKIWQSYRHQSLGPQFFGGHSVEFQYGGRLGEFIDMSSQSHVSHCRVLPLGEFTVTIPEPHATLQGAITWWNQCRDRATLQGVRIPSGILKIVFRHIFFNAV